MTPVLQGRLMFQEAARRYGGGEDICPVRDDEQPKSSRSPKVELLSGIRHGASEVLRSGSTPRNQQGKKRRPGSATKSVADMMRGWPTHKPKSKDEQAVGWATLSDGARLEGTDTQLDVHRRLLGGLGALQRVRMELELNFQAVVSLPAPAWGLDNSGLGKAAPRVAHNGPPTEEIAVQFELQGSIRTLKGRAQSVLLRTPWAFEMLHRSSGSHSHPARAPTPSTRPGTPRGETATPLMALMDGRTSSGLSARYSPEDGLEEVVSDSKGWFVDEKALVSQKIGDNGHAMSLNLSERVPETLIIRRVGQRENKTGSQRLDAAGSTEPLVLPSLQALMDDPAAAVMAEGQAAHSEVADISAGPKAWVESVEAECAHLQKNLAFKLSGQGEDVAAKGSEEKKTQKASPEGLHLEDYLRDLRSVLRLVGPGLPSAARLVEGAVKGVMVAIDCELQGVQKQLAACQGLAEVTIEINAERDSLRTEISQVQEQYKLLEKRLLEQEELAREDEKANLEKISKLKDEVARLNPDDCAIDGIVPLMDDCSNLLEEMEEEGLRQGKILSRLTKYTANIVRDTADVGNPNSSALHKPGRVIELANGEIELRTYTMQEQETQVQESDLLKVNPEAPINFRPPTIRRLLCTFQGRQIEKDMRQDALWSEIDKIYTAKAQADADADAAGQCRSELTDFVVEYYLDQMGTVTAAQGQLCSILECLRSTMRSASTDAPVPLKIMLFAQFLEFCQCNEALPLPVLNVALHARCLAQAARLRSKDAVFSLQLAPGMLVPRGIGKDRSARSESVMKTGAEWPPSETPIAVPIAWDSASKALPNGGSETARRELFLSLMNFASITGDDDKRPGMKEFYFLLLIVHDRIKREAAPKMRELIARVEGRGQASADDFREALRDAEIVGIDESIWRSQLMPANMSQPGMLAEMVFTEFFGGGSPNRLPKGSVTESEMLVATATAMTAEVKERVDALRKLYRQNKGGHIDLKNMKLKYEDFKSVLQSADSSLTTASIRSLWLSCVETSRSCFQYEGDACPIGGSMDTSPNGLYGGDTVTLSIVQMACLRNDLSFSADAAMDFGVSVKNGDAGPAASRSGRGSLRGGIPGKIAKSSSKKTGR